MTDALTSPAAGAAPTAGDTPVRADGVTLIGEMVGSGYRVPPALARRADGQTVQLTPLLYATLATLDGRRTYAEVAAAVAADTGRPVSEENVRELVGKLREIGLVTREDGTEPELRRSNPLLGLKFKVAVTDPDTTRRVTAPFAALFHLAVVLPVLAAFVAICWWVLVEKGLASPTHDAFARPGLLLVVLVITVLSAGFHEFGHASAAARGGARPGVMGAGLYLVWPAFYTDVTDSYRLGRAGRLCTDLGGLYFNAIVAVATMGVWWVSRYDAVLLLVATQILQMLRQLLPFVRFDGYHVLADLTGVPDLFHRIGPTLGALVPWTPTSPKARELKPWARAVVTVWVLTVVPLLLAVAVLMVVTLPRLVGTAWASARAQQAVMTAAFGEGDVLSGLARLLAMVVVILPIGATLVILVRLVRQVGGTVWRRTDGRPVRRGLAGVVALAIVAGLAYAWWPVDGRYRAVQAYESGTLGDALALARPQAGFAVGSQGTGTVMWPSDAELPTREQPQLATVLVPTAPAAGDPATSAPQEGDVEQAGAGTWIFPFDEPLAPGEGDNQALAVNTTDDTIEYSVAFALVWADGETPVDNTNEAYAIASCDNCAAVAVAFQVVLVVGEADVAVPVNTSVAVNYDCTSCLTYSLAVQLFVTLDGPLGDDAMARMEELWAQIMEFGQNIGSIPLDQIQDQLSTFEEQILDIIEEDQGPLTEDPAATGSASPSGSASPTEGTTSSSSEPTESTATSPSPTTTTSTSASSTPTTSPSPTASATPTEDPQPTSSGSVTPTSEASPAEASASP